MSPQHLVYFVAAAHLISTTAIANSSVPSGQILHAAAREPIEQAAYHGDSIQRPVNELTGSRIVKRRAKGAARSRRRLRNRNAAVPYWLSRQRFGRAAFGRRRAW